MCSWIEIIKRVPKNDHDDNDNYNDQNKNHYNNNNDDNKMYLLSKSGVNNLQKLQKILMKKSQKNSAKIFCKINCTKYNNCSHNS